MNISPSILLKSLRWLELDQWELRKLFSQSVATIQNVPLVLILFLLIRFLFLFRLGLYCQFLELIAIHFNVGAHNLICYSRYSLIPVLLLGAVS